MNHLYEIATGRLISSTALDITDTFVIPAGMAIKVSSLTGTWNETTLDFDPLPEPEVRVGKIEFLDLFTDTELDAILDAEEADKNVRRFLKKLDLADSIGMSNQSTIDGLNYMEAVGLIASGRAAVILNG